MANPGGISLPIPRRRAGLAAFAFPLVGLLLVPACTGLGRSGDLDRPPASGSRSQLVPPAPGPALPQDPLETIARFEAARDDGDGLLQMLLARGEEESTRARAATALGRLPHPDFGAEVTRALVAALDDASATVRAQAAFALGMRADPAAADALLAHWKEPAADVRARIVEAASRIEDPRLRTEILHALHDPAPKVRQEAALAPHRWSPNGADGKRAADADVVDSALVAITRAAPPAASGTHEPQVVWRALFALQRRKAERARAAFLASLHADDARERIFAAQGLGAIAADPASNAALRRNLGDPDWRVVYEAVAALGKHPDAEGAVALAGLRAHPSPHVRRAVCEALGSFAADAEAADAVLGAALDDASANVRAAAIEARAKLRRDAARELIESASTESRALLRAAAMRGAAFLSEANALPLLVRGTDDPDRVVAQAAAAGLAAHPGDASRARLRALLAAPDNGLRLAGVEGLQKIGTPADLDALRACFASSRGEIAPEIAFNVLRAAATIGGPAAQSLLEQGLAHPDPYVRKVARDALAKHFPASAPSERAAQQTLPPAPTPPAESWRRNPRVEIVTSRGVLVFELFPDEAPAHVASFLELVRRNHYDKLCFHRVAPDFVIQGGDPRGDGNGGAPARGDALKAEFTPRKTVRGSLGTPRNDDPDSGGSQIFVTHRETPHLDGRYTIFGELRDGFDVLDAIEVGDLILTVRLGGGAPGG